MNLNKKKILAAKTLNVGKNRIRFNVENLAEIKEAITKQDIRDLYASGIISIKEIKGRKKIIRRKIRRGPGKIKKKINRRKQIYVKITRKLRAYIAGLRMHGVINRDLYLELRKKIRMRAFRSKAHLKEYLKNIEMEKENKKISSEPKKKISTKKETLAKDKKEKVSKEKKSEEKKSTKTKGARK